MKVLSPPTVRAASAPLEKTDSLHKMTVLGQLCEYTTKSSPSLNSDTLFRVPSNRMCCYCVNLAGNAREGINILIHIERGSLCLDLNLPNFASLCHSLV